jgi:hypothetical protein
VIMDAGSRDAKQAELTAELRKARGWLLAVGIIIFLMSALIVYAIYPDRLPDSEKSRIMILGGIQLAIYFGLWLYAKTQAKVACVLGLVVFWGFVLYNASIDPSSLYKGILIKILFTVALINGLRSASRAETLRKELSEVFS